MELENAYYKKIIYKKNAYEDLKAYIKLNYSNKNICLVSTKSVPAEDVTKLLNAIFCGSNKVDHFVVRNNFSYNELDKLKDKITKSGYHLIVSLGGGRCCDAVKYFSYLFKLPYVVCPTTATSIAYFTNYCINPYNSSKSFYAKMPNKIFIQESQIKQATCSGNINGLCFLQALRCVFVEGIINDNEKERYIFLALEKLFSKLDKEYTNILLCEDDSNLVLMDLFIDFSFFINLLGREYYLYKAYELSDCFGYDKNEFCGKSFLLLAKTILTVLKKYLELNTFKIIEKPKYIEISKIIKNAEIYCKNLKNIKYFDDFLLNVSNKRNYKENKEGVYKLICKHLMLIKVFTNDVKSVYKKGIQIEENYESVSKCVLVAPYLYGNNYIIDFLAGSGVLNSLI